MRCCVPSCNNCSENSSQAEGITFYSFPSEGHLRAAWLRALGKQDSHLPDSAVVCSQHFLNDDFYETESGIRQIRTGAIPSTVQVCRICLDTDSKLVLMSKYKLEEEYEKLTQNPLCDQGNLKQTVCIQCAQRLINFSTFRAKSLRARALMMDLVGKHKLVTRQHIKMINRTKHQLKSNMVLTSLGPDHCDLHILEHPSGDKQTESEETRLKVTVKIEENDESMQVDDMEMKNEDDNDVNDFVQDPLKYESASLQCTLCLEEFVHEHVYMQHMNMHLQNNDGDGECDMSQVCKPHTAVSSSSSHSSLITENKQAAPSPCARAATTLVAPLPESLATDNGIKAKGDDKTEKFIEIDIDFNYQAASGSGVNTTENKQSDNFMNPLKYESASFQCTFCLEEFAHEHAYMQHMNMHLQNGAGDGECDASQECKPHTAVSSSHSSLSTENKQADPSPSTTLASRLSANFATFGVTLPTQEANTSDQQIPSKQTNDESKRFVCQYCPFRCKYQSNFTTHMRTHTGEKPFACTHCDYKCVTNSGLVNHMRTHTGDKPYSCKICDFKSSYKGNLVGHMRTHTGEKPFACTHCEYKSVTNSALVNHLRTHTGEKPYSCEFCEYKCVSNTALLKHLRTHTGEKRFSCELCEYKCVSNSALMNHMRTHTGEKPFSCKVCDYKFAHKSHLVRHMKTHTGEKPYLCKFCEYRTAHKDNLVNHTRTHTGERPYWCEVCEYKSAAKSKLVIHMRTHTGEKPFGCDLCEFKCAVKHNLVIHRRSHTGDK
ncbi:zinc finger protein 84-like isoform X1 [Maniola jurtina]|uniref:zinc finger protein 84-like isoform X1 n=1 Tax=Maniola jurtina TaxID=191418 RepID=UPI001E689F7C|nr:zinc finger protein 84-like isoform X1 [Maniola jurtina]